MAKGIGICLLQIPRMRSNPVFSMGISKKRTCTVKCIAGIPPREMLKVAIMTFALEEVKMKPILT
ncbi:hypothetical protein T4B_10433 [Trichinella pseudospiralis]|uniref:Uncharacterized protein n=1 Tax=Trichinella pseudospiralis TaxID=6337 RepID=A0A0V1IXP0_TRIPS|nr:hypothetical protein T4B_10433 [Trichinella pseudospiralis]